METRQKEIIENYIKSYNDFDVKGMLKDLHETVKFQNVSNGEVNLAIEGLEQFKAQAETATSYFKERKQTITSWDFQDNLVKIEIEYVGVLAIDLPNGMKTGETLQLTGTSEFLFQKDKIISIIDRS